MKGENFMLNDNVFVARQPILNRYQEIFGYELLFRKSGDSNLAEIHSDMQATSRVLVNVLNNIGLEKMVGGKKGFINIDESFIKSGIMNGLDKEHFIFEILEHTEIDAVLAQRIRNMAEDGFQFALDDFIINEKMTRNFKPLFDIVKFVKIDLFQNNKDSLEEKIKIFKPYTTSLLAEKVETADDFKLCRNLGFDYYQGYFFAKPNIMQGRSIDPERMAIMSMVRLLQNDPDVEEVVEAFKIHPDLTINLLKFINSAAIFTRSRISSVRQAVALIGQKQLMQWLLLMMYAGHSGNKGSGPLFMTASQRAKTMEVLLKDTMGVKDRNELDIAFLVGILSLLDSLFQMPIQEILQELNVGQEVIEAITGHKGMLGQLLLLVEKAEKENTIEMNLLLEHLKVTMKDYSEAALSSMQWTAKLQNFL